MDIKEIRNAVQNLSASSKSEAHNLIAELQNLLSDVESALSDIGVEHNIRIYLGDYGNGRQLVLPSDLESDYHPTHYGVGDWLPSSETC